MWLKLEVNLFGFVDLRWAVQDPVPPLLCSVKSDETQSNCRTTDSNLPHMLFSDFPHFFIVLGFPTFSTLLPTFSTLISHIFNSDFPHFRPGFLTFSTQICNCRPLLSLIVKLLPNCEFIFTFEYFSNIQIQVSYPFYLHTSQDTHQSTFLSFWLCILKSQLENI